MTVAISRVEKIHVSSAARVAFGLLLASVLTAGVVAGIARYGFSTTAIRNAWAALHSAPPATGEDNQQRLFSVSLNGRAELWRTAAHVFQVHPLWGAGAGTFWIFWARAGQPAGVTLQAHSLYMQMLAELGVLGLGIVVALVLLPFVAAVRRRDAAGPAAAFSVFAIHSAVDWDWQLGAVTAAALILGVGVAQRTPLTMLRRTRSWALSAAVGALVLVAAPQLVADQEMSAATSHAKADPALSLRKANDAGKFAPWSSEPLALAGDAERNRGHAEAAAADYRRAIAKDPKNWTLWARLAGVSRPPERTRALAEARALNPLIAGPRPVRKASAAR
jgi:hypothetical protein